MYSPICYRFTVRLFCSRCLQCVPGLRHWPKRQRRCHRV
nr:MAG TPA: hypothetical protein [Caudoviricetes sp.]